MKLKLLKIKNFKGIKTFILDAGADGSNVTIYGDNATGKTTIFDAFTWLLFDKDSDNRKEFEIKTLDDDGEPHHGLDHEVEGVFILGGDQLSLRKIYREKWSKKRGSAEKQFSGHTTDYYIDGVPVKKKEYVERVAEIADEGVFRLLTDPAYFNEQMHWQERRRLLLEVCGDTTDDDVIASDDALAALPEILGDRSLEDHRKVIAARRAEINKELERIPVRIDEVTQGLSPTPNTSKPALEKELKKLKAKLEDLQEQRARIEAGGEIAEKTKELRELEAELQDLENQAKEKAREKRRAAEGAISELDARIEEIGFQLTLRRRGFKRYEKLAAHLENRLEDLRREWQQVNAWTFEDEQETVCPACGQDLPSDQAEEAREKALAQFNASKAHRLEKIDAEGKTLKKEAQEAREEAERLKSEAEDLESERETLTKKRDSIEVPPVDDIALPPEHGRIQDKISKINEEIVELKDDNSRALDKIDWEIEELRAKITDLESDLWVIRKNEQGKERIEELKAQEKALAAEYEQLEKELYLTEQFTRTKVRLLDEKINSRFKMARFRLFRELVNGAIEECCETLYQGVPYSDLNNGARINVGLDIIRTLSEHFGFSAPIFIDNAEAVTELLATNSQMIRLVVSEADKTLRIMRDNQGGHDGKAAG